VVVNLLFLKSRPLEKKRISGMTKSRLALKNVSLALIVKKNQEILLPEQIAPISKKKVTLVFVLLAAEQQEMVVMKEDPTAAIPALLNEMAKELHHAASGITALVRRESLMATAQNAEPMVTPQDLTVNLHRTENENLIAIVHHAEQMAKTTVQDLITNVHRMVKELLMEIVRHAEQMAKTIA
jgi:hypothetical protein